MFTPVNIEFGDQQDIAERMALDGREWRATSRPVPFQLPAGAFLVRLRLTLRDNVNAAGDAEAFIHIEYLEPRR